MMRVLAAAKINLALDVRSRRSDGYHEVDMVMQSVDLYDELFFEESAHLSLSVDGDAPANDDNLIMRAAKMLQAYGNFAKGARIHLNKRIPTAAGLGGGSADAAATMVALRALWDLSITDEGLIAVGSRLGVDIPFCIVGGTMRATGIGTQLSPLPSPPPMALVIARPCDGISTREVYQGLRLDESLNHPNIDGMASSLAEQNLAGICANMGNVLESVTIPARPQVAATMDRMRALGALQARMSGSGPSVFGIFSDRSAAERACRSLGMGFVCIPTTKGVLINP
jgi:4-diphosphocytidyl-2-C-methyl-D-erythritol kinase